ncbi:MAG: hypothetical protein KJ601_04890 [Nanoarchaeota archaeon]|nr:hypothetical protein [Nanoarchaeota archaeon]MBU1704077.1 hypothetical protein [Nanoarchaeota archaeon]
MVKKVVAKVKKVAKTTKPVFKGALRTIKPRIMPKHIEGEICEMVDGKIVCKKQKMKVYEVNQ